MTDEKKERDAGRELDAEIAERVFDAVVNRSERGGWGMFKRDGERLWLNADTKVPDFSSSIATAFLVVEAMAKRGWKVDVQNRYEGCYACHVFFPADVSYGRIFEKATSFSDGTGSAGALAALAICRAAMAAFDLLASSAKSAVSETETPVSPASL